MTLDELNELMKSKGLEGQDVKLDVGAGGQSGDASFLSVDLFTEADIVATMWDIPLPDKSVDAIYCCNALEHISKFQVIPTLKEFNRVLKVGGHLLLIVPDLEWTCKWWLKHQDTSWNMDILYGNQKHDGEYHRTGFTKKILFRYISEATGLKVQSLEFSGGKNYIYIKENDYLNSLVENVEQREIIAEIEKVHDVLESPPQYLEFQMGKRSWDGIASFEFSTEMAAPGSVDPLSRRNP